MPIRPENRARYPRDWRELSERIRHERARNRCECQGECGSSHANGRCNAPNGAWVLRDETDRAQWSEAKGPQTAGAVRIVLTVAHLDHVPENCADANLLALCQLCHNRLDAPERARRRQERKRAQLAQAGQRSLPIGGQHERDE